MHTHLYGGVEFALLAGLDPFQPLNGRLAVAADFALEGRGSPVDHGGVDRVGSGQDGHGVGALCKQGRETRTESQTKCCFFFHTMLFIRNERNHMTSEGMHTP